eukprot:m.86398 g.86398  ORF g.86398 m.86398 type:complete len:383 (+) comp16374_c1_seq10:148-1296(+)
MGDKQHTQATQDAAMALVVAASAAGTEDTPSIPSGMTDAGVLQQQTPVPTTIVAPDVPPLVDSDAQIMTKTGKKPDGRSANRKGPPKDLHSRIEAASARRKRERRLEFCVKMCIQKGWGYRKAVGRRELAGYIDKKEMMSLKRRLQKAKHEAAHGDSMSAKEKTDGRFLLCTEDEQDVTSWLTMCNRIQMNVSIADFKRAVLKTLTVRHANESQPGFPEEKKVLSKNAQRVLQNNVVSSRFVDHFKTRHPEVIIGGWAKTDKLASAPMPEEWSPNHGMLNASNGSGGNATSAAATASSSASGGPPPLVAHNDNAPPGMPLNHIGHQHPHHHHASQHQLMQPQTPQPMQVHPHAAQAHHGLSQQQQQQHMQHQMQQHHMQHQM